MPPIASGGAVRAAGAVPWPVSVSVQLPVPVLPMVLVLLPQLDCFWNPIGP